MLSTVYKTVCLGGTFDTIHQGHRILFGDAIKICRQRLIVGVTGPKMIEHKVLWELITPVEDRMVKVREYLQSVNPNLTYDVVAINDLYGPTITEENIDCIVVSKETVKGAAKINEARKSKGWRELSVHIVNILEDTDASHQDVMNRLHESKISSSISRVDKLGSVVREPIPNSNIPEKPYLIGLTGGIASGKTSIGKYLESIGFGYINYDLVAHKTYENIGSPAYVEIVQTFGVGILDEAKKINRSILGKIVFSDKEKLTRLNEIVWPRLYLLVDEMIEQLKEKHDVIVLESALLIESKQFKRVHQVWTSIIPPSEAIKRQVESRGLSHEEAEKRVKAQVDNLTRVQASNVVFCSLWDQLFTQQQVDKAVRELRNKYLDGTK